ncbi:RNA-directed DNA polymerase [Sphingobacterium sp. BIGb0116]|uniref:RNA-directed DNA polymerase n=1 Tax=Sphingobacterium sp. BIGb0116 TaxID=2940619 RepID=UPI0021692A8E|nr:RNA-directed DNA polymerase [Sphingobacterium sp. BIGb0116]MCS4162946.1 hypothetical protein [Sphingobacterium sp. BIGb0116]
MLTDRFEELRKKSLKRIFETQNITRVWRDTVRGQLRNLDFQDYFDNYDLNFNIDNRSKVLQNEILKGNYKTSNPLIYKLEKKLGICRHVVIPNAIDALVLQVLIEDIAEEILNKQPSKNSFYSRDKHAKPNPLGIFDSNDFKALWKRMQKEIYKFQEQRELIVVTDLSNYYDTIHVKELKKVLSSYCRIDEVLLDLLFKIIEDISWRPDYLPYSFRGLPTTNIEGVRLLAHSFMFEIDDILKIKSGESFTRWMDDITFAVDDKKEAVKIINSISDLLKSRGLALNISKTKIFSKDQASQEFLIDENKYIDNCEKIISIGSKVSIEDIVSKFREHLTKNTDKKYFDKVTKRYLTLISKVNSEWGYEFLEVLYLEYPQLRSHILLFLGNNGYNKMGADVITKIISKIEVFDDISLHHITKLICQWEIKNVADDTSFINGILERIEAIFKSNKIIMNYLSVLMFKTKYSHAEDLFNFIVYWKAIWEDHTYGRRQVMACLARLINTQYNDKVIKIIHSNISSGILSVITICTQIIEFSQIRNIERKMLLYLFPTNKPKAYPFYKFLVLCSVLNSEPVRKNKQLNSSIKEHITDPFYLKWIEDHYNIKIN